MKKLLVVVDFQNDFVNGALGFPGAESLAPRIAAKVRTYREGGNTIVWTLDTHDADYLDTREGVNLPIMHCVKGTLGHNLHPVVEREWREGDPTFFKPGFGSWDLARWLRARCEADEQGKPFESIELVGLVTNICVLSNAMLVQAVCENASIIVDAACVASFDEQLHEKTLDVMEGIQVQVINRS